MTVSVTKLLDPLWDAVVFLVGAAVIWKGAKPPAGGQRWRLLSSGSQIDAVGVIIYSSAALKLLKSIQWETCYPLSVPAVGERTEIQTHKKCNSRCRRQKTSCDSTRTRVASGGHSRLLRALSSLKTLKLNNLNLLFSTTYSVLAGCVHVRLWKASSPSAVQGFGRAQVRESEVSRISWGFPPAPASADLL